MLFLIVPLVKMFVGLCVAMFHLTVWTIKLAFVLSVWLFKGMAFLIVGGIALIGTALGTSRKVRNGGSVGDDRPRA